MARLLYLHQNAWVALARGAWDKDAYPKDHAALSKVIGGVRAQAIMAPLSFANIYETAKINDPARRANMARTQAVISRGRVFRGHRRILGETLTAYLARHHGIARAEPDAQWFCPIPRSYTLPVSVQPPAGLLCHEACVGTLRTRSS